MDIKDKIDKDRLPKHVAVIMDGNGRWAKTKGLPRVFGHKNGVKAVREITEGAAEIGISYLTLYAFSTENWGRPTLEVKTLMTLLVDTIRSEIKTLQKNNIRLKAIGDISGLPNKTANELRKAIEETKDNERMDLILALNYSGKWDVIEAVKCIAKQVEQGDLRSEDITEDAISEHLSTAGIPDPELMIRSSGEQRISNFLLWQLAYAELYFTPKYWPEFKKRDFFEAILNYQNRERRFGKISEQIV